MFPVALPVSLGDKEDVGLCDSLGTDCPGPASALLAQFGFMEMRRMSHELLWTHPEFSPDAGGGFLGAGGVPGSWVPLQIPIPSLEALAELVALFSSSSAPLTNAV